MSCVNYLAYSLLNDPVLTIGCVFLVGMAVGVFAAMAQFADRGNSAS